VTAEHTPSPNLNYFYGAVGVFEPSATEPSPFCHCCPAVEHSAAERHVSAVISSVVLFLLVPLLCLRSLFVISDTIIDLFSYLLPTVLRLHYGLGQYLARGRCYHRILQVPQDVSQWLVILLVCTPCRLPSSLVRGQESMMCDIVQMLLQSNILLFVRPQIRVSFCLLYLVV